MVCAESDPGPRLNARKQAKTMIDAYRSLATPGQQPLKPLEPEMEMKLIVAGGPRATRPRWLLWSVLAALGAALLVSAPGFKTALISVGYMFFPTAVDFGAWLRLRRQMAELRRRGYDVDTALRTLRWAERPASR